MGWRAAWILVFVVGCSGKDAGTPTSGDDDDDTTPPLSTTSDGGCRDPQANPFAGSCVETFFGRCFDPEGACTGARDGATGFTLTWDNGAMVVQDRLVTELVASDGTVCITGQTEVTPAGECFSTTTYTDDDGGTVAYCVATDGSLTVTCPDGTSFEVTATQAESSSTCQYGGGEDCTFE